MIGLILCLTLMLPTMSACHGNQQISTSQQNQTQLTTQNDSTQTTADDITDYKMPTVDEDFFELVCENSDVTCYLLSNGFRTVQYILLSAQDLKGQTVTFTSDLGYTIERVITSQETSVPISHAAFMAYQSIDWLSLEGSHSALMAQVGQAQTGYDAARISTPWLYSYTIVLALSELGAGPVPDENGFMPDRDVIAALPPQRIETLTVTIGNQTKVYNLGNVIALGEAITENVDPQARVDMKNPGILDYPVYPSANGVMEISSLEYHVTEDAVLCGFTVPGTEVLQCEIKVTTPTGDKYNFLWDCASPLEVDEGSEFSLKNIVIRDPFLAGKLMAVAWRYPILHYTCGGEEFDVAGQICIRMRQDPFDVYALKVDGVDMMPYYLEYLNYEE